ncbi:MAG: low molecular weight protein tyrosine phosphatase family protein [Woeseia sp.]
MTRILFICSENRLRSPTAETVFSEYEGVEALSAGTNAGATTPVTEELIEWADVILVMEKYHKSEIYRRFPGKLRNKKVGVLDLPDIYDYMEPVLIQLLREKVPSYVRI